MAKVNMPSKREPVRKVVQVEVVDEELVEDVETLEKNNSPIPLAVANCMSLNVRSGPTKESAILCTIPVGTIVMVDLIDPKSDWLHIVGFGDKDQKSPNSKAGYILANNTSEV